MCFARLRPWHFLHLVWHFLESYVKENRGKSVIFSPSSLMPLQFWAKTLVGMGRRYSFRVEPLCIGLCCNVLFTQLVLCKLLSLHRVRLLSCYREQYGRRRGQRLHRRVPLLGFFISHTSQVCFNPFNPVIKTHNLLLVSALLVIRLLSV